MNKLIPAAAICGGILLALAAPLAASAHDKAASISCDTASVSLTNYDQGATAKITLDGVVEFDGTFGGRLVESRKLDPTVDHRLQVRVVSLDGSRYNFDFDQTTTGCKPVIVVPPEPPREPAEPVLTSSLSCEDFTVTETRTEGSYGFTLVDNVWIRDEAPTYGEPTSTTRPATDEECPVVLPPTEPPVVTPPAVEPPAVVPPVTPPAAVTPPAVVTPLPVSPPEALAYTGVSDVSTNLVPVGVAVLLAGGMVVALARRMARR